MPCMSGREAVTDEELAEVERLSATDLLAEMAPRLVPEVRAARLWRTLALALIATRARGNAPEVLRAIDELEQMGERVPAVVRLP